MKTYRKLARPFGLALTATALAVALALVAGAGGCFLRPAAFWSKPAENKLPADIREWIANSLPLDAGQWRTAGGKTYVLVTWGPKPTGGYDVEIVDVARPDQSSPKVTVTLRYTQPPAGAGTGGPTRPYDIVAVNLAGAEVEWRVEGKPDAYVMGVLGEVRPIVAESTWIKLFEPAAGARVTSPFVIAGLASVFEGTVSYRLSLAGGPTLLESFTTAAMGDWGRLWAEVSYTLPTGAVDPATGAARGVLEVFWYSPMDGSEVDKITLPLELGG